MKSIHQRSSQLLLVLSGIAIVLFVVLRAGIGATPYETADNAGRHMGFNDPLGLDHYRIIIRNFSPSLLIRPEYFYEWILCAAYTIGCALVFSRTRFGTRSTRWFFAIQALIFPFAWLGLAALPIILKDIFTGRMDREGFIDIPFLWVTAHTVWVITSVLIALVMPGESLALKKFNARFGSLLR
jgi:hypothetical protein